MDESSIGSHLLLKKNSDDYLRICILFVIYESIPVKLSNYESIPINFKIFHVVPNLNVFF